VVYSNSKRPFAGQVVAYLGRYTHRVAISNERLVGFQDGEVQFRWKDSLGLWKGSPNARPSPR